MSVPRLLETKSGHLTIELEDNKRKIRLHSAFDPVKEAERSISQFSTTPRRIILVAGCGLGYHIEALKKKYPENLIIVIEKDPQIITLCRENQPQVLNNIFVVTREDELPAFFESVNIASFKGSSVFFHRQSYTLYKEFYDTVIADASRYISSKISDLLTRFEFEERWVENILQNCAYLKNGYPAASLFGKFHGIPGVLVSAGPSLKDSATWLKEIADKALILCVDTAYKVLVKFGIKPHIVMVLDAQKHSLFHFLGAPSKECVLVADMVSSPKVLQHSEFIPFFSTTTKYYDDQDGKLQRETTPFMDWLERYIAPPGDIQSGGSVATSAFDLLLNCGCSEIILFGQDLAYTGRKIHSTGTHHNEKWVPALNRFKNLETINQQVVRKRKIKMVPDVSGTSEIMTDFVLDLYRSWFSDSAQKVDLPVYNATAEGAAIEGAPHIDLREHFKNYRNLASSPQKIIESIISKEEHFETARLEKALNEALRRVDRFKDEITKEGTPWECKTLMAKLCSEDLDTMFMPFIKKTLTYISRHELASERETKLLLDELVRASHKVITLFNRTLATL